MENNKLFVTNLNFTTDVQKLVDLCATVGEVKAFYRPEGKGFAFITMANDADASKVIDQLNGTMLDGRALRIEVSVPKEQRPSRPEGSAGAGPRREGSGGSDFRPRPSSGFSSPPPSGGSNKPEFKRSDDKKKQVPRKEEPRNGVPKTPRPEKEKGGPNNKRWLDEIEDEEIIDDPMKDLRPDADDDL